MKTTIDNSQRKFLVQSKSFSFPDTFCNLKDLPQVLNQSDDIKNDVIVLHYWDRKLKKVSKRFLNEMFASNQIQYKLD